MPEAEADRLASEGLAAAGELAALLADPYYWGLGVPRGDGRLVLVLPGLFANDLYLQPMRDWLARAGYRPVRSTLALNAGCGERLSRQIESELARRLSRRERPVAIIGHSRGGVLGKAIATRLGERASHLCLLGSPAGFMMRMAPAAFDTSSGPAPRAVVEASLRARRLLDPDCTFPQCGCPFPGDLRAPLGERTRVLSLYSKEDAVVPWEACRVPGARNVEVKGSHSGMAYNPAVYRLLAEFLSQRS